MKKFLVRLVLLCFSASMLYCSQKLQNGESGCRQDDDCEANEGTLPACRFVAACLNRACEGCDIHSCRVDTDCGNSQSCKLCEKGGNGICRDTCVGDSTCGEGDVCTDNRCVPRPCEDDSSCPVNFRCESAGCMHATCTKDEDCMGYCVHGLCTPALGRCISFD